MAQFPAHKYFQLITEVPAKNEMLQLFRIAWAFRSLSKFLSSISRSRMLLAAWQYYFDTAEFIKTPIHL